MRGGTEGGGRTERGEISWAQSFLEETPNTPLRKGQEWGYEGVSGIVFFCWQQLHHHHLKTPKQHRHHAATEAYWFNLKPQVVTIQHTFVLSSLSNLLHPESEKVWHDSEINLQGTDCAHSQVVLLVSSWTCFHDLMFRKQITVGPPAFTRHSVLVPVSLKLLLFLPTPTLLCCDWLLLLTLIG